MVTSLCEYSQKTLTFASKHRPQVTKHFELCGTTFVIQAKTAKSNILYYTVHTHIATHAYTHMYTHIHTYIYTHTHTDSYIYTHIHTCIHTHTHTHTHNHTYTLTHNHTELIWHYYIW